MRFNLMDEVYIQSDTLNLGVPVGEVGRVIMLDPRIYQAQPYLVRVPSKKEAWWMPGCDLMEYATWLEQNADSTIRDTLINHALETGNVELFHAVLSDEGNESAQTSRTTTITYELKGFSWRADT